MEIKNTYPIRLSILFWSILALFLGACKKDGATVNYERPVVEGYLIPGQPITVKVYYQKYLEDTISYGYPIKDLKLTISQGNNTISLTEVSEGTYTYSDHHFVKENGTYRLNFTCFSKEISAVTTVPSKPKNFTVSGTEQIVPTFTFGQTPTAFVPLQFTWSNQHLNDYYMLSFQCAESSPIKLSSRRPNNNSSLNTETIVGQSASYYTSEENFIYSGAHRVLLFHINKEYYSALTNNSRASSLNLTNPATNVTNGLGIFTGLIADTLHINVSQ